MTGGRWIIEQQALLAFHFQIDVEVEPSFSLRIDKAARRTIIHGVRFP